MAKKYFIQGAIKRPGSLHRALNVPQGKKIPSGLIARAAASRNKKLAKKAQFAKELKGLRK